MKRLFCRRPSVVGLDIQPDGLRLVRLQPVLAGFEILCVAAVSLPEAIFADSKIKRWDLLEQAIADLVREYKLEGSFVVTGLPAALVRAHKFSLPAQIPMEAVEVEIKTHIQRELPDLTDVLCMDYAITPSLDLAYQDVFFVVARQEYITQLTQCMQAVKLQLKIIDIDVYALQRFLATDAAVLHIANLQATFIVSGRNDIIFHQSWNMSTAADFLTQFKSSLQLCRAMHGDVIHKIVMYGDYAAFGLQSAQIAEVSDCVCEYPGPAQCLSISDSVNLSPAFYRAAGLAMREIPRWL